MDRQLSAARLSYLNLMREIEDFLYAEADLLDEREFEKWLDLFTDDLRYWMPMRKNLEFHDRARDITGENDVAWIDDDKATLTKRVKQMLTGIHWAEEPVSRVSHLISNIRLAEPVDTVAEGASVLVKSHFLVHRNRLETETDFIAGRRQDTLRRAQDTFRIARRKIIIDQSILLAKNLTFFL
ncbi:MAG TPA: 3-phenylpropionate/cinnamic acid dioxygenase subunit beta [Candidatus Binataceae bacterium]|nr:3-phenylpropionate/cinnamic acid dioxygenase subunit beta [Candidatus Binataceae bacterium]